MVSFIKSISTLGTNFPETVHSFTGKKLDAETGYSYFGARYYDPATLAVWLSVVPMSDKYPSISPYAYCAWNPLKLVDPDGEDFDPVMQEYASRVKKYCNRQISELEKIETLSDRQSEQLNGYRNTISEIDKLENDHSTLYRFGKHTNNESTKDILGFTTYGGVNEGKNVINITIREDGFLEDDNLNMKGLGAISHELKHAYQYYSGESAFAINKDGVCIMYNHEDLEIPAYNRGAIFCGLNAKQIKVLKPETFESLYNKNYSNLTEFETYFRGKNYQIIKH